MSEWGDSMQGPGKFLIRCAPAVVGMMLLSGCGAGKTTADGVGGAGGQEYATPSPVTAGDYRNPVLGPEAEARGNEAARAEDAKPKVMAWMNGIYLWPDYRDLKPGQTPDPASNPRPPCPGKATIPSEAELRASPFFIDIPDYLPPGARETEAPYGEKCGDTLVLISRQFALGHYGSYLGIVRRIGTRAAQSSTSVDRVSSGVINGKPALFIRPLNAEGFGGSGIFILDGDVVTSVGGLDMPFSDVLRVARGVK